MRSVERLKTKLCVMSVLATGDTMVGVITLITLTMEQRTQLSLACDLVSMVTVCPVPDKSQCQPGECPREFIMTLAMDTAVTRATV